MTHPPAAPEVRIRRERPDDADAIGVLTQAAFRDLAYSSQTEAFIVAALRAANVLTVSLVAECGRGRAGHSLVGHIAFSPVTISDGSPHWYGLGPVSVLPQQQGRGIGSALVWQGLQQIEQMGAQGCVVLGNPHFYTRFGFAHAPGLMLSGVPPEYFLALPLSTLLPMGEVAYHPAFEAQC